MRRIALAVALLSPTLARAGDATISNGRTTPVETAAADGNSAGNVTVTGNGSIVVDTGPAITLNSDNAVDIAGSVEVTNDTNAVGVLIEGGHAGSFTSSGSIDALVTDDDGIAVGSGNVAFWVSGNGAFIGNIAFESGATVTSGGTGSNGLLLDTDIQGGIDIAGTVTVAGASSTAVEANGAISGDFTTQSGSAISASGDGARGVLLAGPIGGAVILSGSISVSGMQANVDYGDGPYPLAKFAVAVGASIAGGFENTGTITASNGGQAIIISSTVSSAPGDILLDVIDAADTPYGFVNRGVVTAANAVNDSTTTAILVAGLENGADDHEVVIEGGIENTGSISTTTSVGGTARGIVLGDHVTTPLLANSGSIAASAVGSETATAYGLLVGASAQLSSLTNSGSITASSSADDAYAYAIVDLGGSLTSITNSGTITATATTTADTSNPGDTDTDGDIGDGATSAVAIDVSHASSGVTLTNSGSIVGDVWLGQYDDTVALIGDGDDDADTSSSWTGSVSFGDGADSFTISGGGTFAGSMTKSGGTLAVTVEDGTVALGESGTISATSVDFRSGATLTLTLDPNLASGPRIEATDSVTFADGASIEAVLEDFVGTDFTAIVARAPTIDAAAAGLDIANLPYLYASQTAVVDGAQQELQISLHLKSASELGFDQRRAAFYDAFIDVLGVADSDVAAPVLAHSDAGSFNRAYDSLMPITSQATTRAAVATSEESERAIADRVTLLMTGDKSYDGINGWWKGSAQAVSVDESTEGEGIDGSVVATSFGLDRNFAPNVLVGAHLTFANAELDGAGAERETRVDATHGVVYGALAAGPFYLSGLAGAGSTVNRSLRTVETEADDALSVESAWDGTFLDASARAGLSLEILQTTIRPWVGVSWLELEEEAHTETSDATGVDLAYDAFDVDIQRAQTGIRLAHTFGNARAGFFVTPEVTASWSRLLNDPQAQLSGRFVDGTLPFTLSQTPLADEQIAAGFGVMMHGKGLAVSFGYDMTLADGEMSHTGKLSFSTVF